VLLLSWNVAGRVKALQLQTQQVLGLGADIICLQEMTLRTLPVWCEQLRGAGYHVAHAGPSREAGPRALMVLSAARTRLETVDICGVPYPERVLATRSGSSLELVNLHSPISPRPGHAKVRTHLAVHRHLASRAEHPRILCGDLNTPRREFPDGTIWTFARDRYGRLRPDRGQEWDRAELALLRGLEPFGFRDAFRELHGYAHREISWGWRRWAGGYRLDHLLVAGGIEVSECRYEHSWRIEGLSDHSPLIAAIELRPSETGERSRARSARGEPCRRERPRCSTGAREQQREAHPAGGQAPARE
jgi:exonuclease III